MTAPTLPASDDPDGHIIVAAGGGEDVIWSTQLDAHIDVAMAAKVPT